MSNPMFKWVDGHHGTGYSILTLAWVTRRWSPIAFDMYILRYPKGSYIPPHRDPLRKGRHFRLNIFLTKPKGGQFVCEKVLWSTARCALFRPDLNTHSVTPIEGHTRYVLSIGWTLK